jgi:hypothetical protein
MNALDGSTLFEKSGFLAKDPVEQFATSGTARTRRQDQPVLEEARGELAAA